MEKWQSNVLVCFVCDVVLAFWRCLKTNELEIITVTLEVFVCCGWWVTLQWVNGDAAVG